MRYFNSTFFIEVEYTCPRHGLERWRIRVSKLWNVGKKEIVPRYGESKSAFVKNLRVGPSVTQGELEDFLHRYFYEKGLENLRFKYL
jgi:hypothetical protein